MSVQETNTYLTSFICIHYVNEWKVFYMELSLSLTHQLKLLK